MFLKAFQSLCSVKAHYLGFHMSQKIYNQLSALNLSKASGLDRSKAVSIVSLKNKANLANAFLIKCNIINLGDSFVTISFKMLRVM